MKGKKTVELGFAASLLWKTLLHRGRKIKNEAITPRSISKPPPAASIGPTQRNGTREITSMRTPKSDNESPRVQFCQRAHHWPGLYSARRPHKISATLRINQAALCRST